MVPIKAFMDNVNSLLVPSDLLKVPPKISIYFFLLLSYFGTKQLAKIEHCSVHCAHLESFFHTCGLVHKCGSLKPYQFYRKLL